MAAMLPDASRMKTASGMPPAHAFEASNDTRAVHLATTIRLRFIEGLPAG